MAVAFNDISEYYVGDLARTEEKNWNITKQYKNYLTETQKVIQEHKLSRVIEIGCGSGFIPVELPEDVFYLGIDKNLLFLDLAVKKNKPERWFRYEDIRKIDAAWLKENKFDPFDLVLCFAVLKHFGLHEWDDIVNRVLRLAPWGLIEMQIANKDIDNGTEFHHVFVSQKHLEQAIHDAGHRYCSESTIMYGNLPDGTPIKSKIVLTKKR